MEVILKQPAAVHRQHISHMHIRHPLTSIRVPDSPQSILTNITAESDHCHKHETKRSEYDKNKFWLEASALKGVMSLQSRNVYNGTVVERRGDSFCVHETPSRSCVYLPYFISKLPEYTEKHCRILIRQLAENVQVLHKSRVAHRNLHIHNVLVDRKGTIQLNGLRYAKAVPKNHAVVGFSGFRHNWYAFRAPESEGDDSHTEAVDVWSLGAILYLLLTGLPPFRGTGRQLTFNKLSSNIEYDMIIPSSKAQALVEGMLKVNQKERLTIDQVLKHEWFQESGELLERSSLSLAQAFFRDWEKKPKMNTTVRPSGPVRFEV